MATSDNGESEVNLHEDTTAGERIRTLVDNGKFQSCTDLNLEYGGGVDDETLRLIGSSCAQLKKLNLNACQQYTDQGLISLSKGCTSLSSLSLYWNVKITDAGVKAIIEVNTELVNLRLSGCKHLTDDGCKRVAEKCPNLTSLDLTRCALLSDASLQALSSSCTRLNNLLLYACSGWADVGVASIVRSMTNLQVLDLCGSREITDKSFDSLNTQKMPHLRRLNLGWCLNLGDAACISISKGCPSLRYLYLLGNKLISLEGLKALAHGAPQLCGIDICGLCLVEDRSMDAMKAHFPALTLLAKLGTAPNYDDD